MAPRRRGRTSTEDGGLHEDGALGLLVYHFPLSLALTMCGLD